jgi:amino acid adenylation domain-containing protein
MKNVEDVYVASPLQQGLIFHGLLAPESSAYSVQIICDLEGKLDVAVLRRAWQCVFERHSVLRTCFVWEDVGEALQVVRKEIELPWREIDWRRMSKEEQEKRMQSVVEEDRRKRFEFSQAPLVRISLVRLSERRAKLVWCHHHSLLDGWSASIVFKEALNFYNALIDGQQLRLPPARPYSDYIAWLQQQDLASAERFWRERLKGFMNPTPLINGQRGLSSADSQSESTDSQSYGEFISLSTETTVALKSLAREHQLTLNTVMQGAWALFLSRYGGVTDVVFGAVVSGRPPELNGVEEMVGLFINTLPVRVRINEREKMLGWLRQLQAEQVEMRGYEYSPLVEVQGWSDIPRGLPLFETMMVFENYPIKSSKQEHEERLQIKNVGSIEKTNYPLSFTVIPADKLVLQLSCDTGYFTKEQVGRMLQHVGRIVEEMAAHPHAQLHELSMLTWAERDEQLVEWNQTKRVYEGAAALPELIEAQVARTPEQVALRYQGELVTYGELNRRANQLAHYLRALGVGAETLVGIMVERSVEMVVGLLGILKAGGAYLPLDPAYPRERLNFMLADAEVAVLLTESQLCERVALAGARVVCLDTEANKIAEQSGENLASEVAAANLAYVIYTSGSTGKPKGVAITHGSAVVLMHWSGEVFSGAELAGVLASTSICFDLSVFEIFVPLSYGGSIVLAENVLELPHLREATAVTLINTVPSAMAELVRVGGVPASVRTVNLAGEPLQNVLVQRVYEQPSIERVLNLYGPSEDTTYSTYSAVEKGSSAAVTIGSPVANTEVYLLDAQLELVPVGVVGEIYLGGEGLARGYMKRAESTAERFVPHRYSARGGARLYRTGDLGRRLADGRIEYLGRVDQQVKVRGFRIELGEIEAVLSRHPELREAVVTVREETVRGPELVAYVVAEGEAAPSSGELREYLGAKLPVYMIPQSFVFLSSLPLTPNGKLDRRALPAPAPMSSEREGNFVAPRDMTEFQMVQVWEDILDIRPVSVNDNFFHLGGHSLLAVRMVAQVEKRLRCRIPLAALFEEPTINHLAKLQRKQMVVLREPSLIPIRTSGTRSPIFFVHPVGGRVFCYSALAAYLDLDRPFYGFQSQVSEDGEPMFTAIESMAAHYVEELRAVQPEGPYFLGGWSMGGVVAFEMARQLQRLEQDVKLLALVDSMIPHFARPAIENVSVTANALPDNNSEPLEEATLLISFAMDLGLSLELLALIHADLLTIEPAQQLTYVLDQARQASVVPADLDLSVIQRLYALFKNNYRALWNYVPKPYAGSALLIKATERENSVVLDPALGWNKLVADLQIREAPGTHYTIVREPYVRTLGQQLEEYCSHLEEYALDHTHLAFVG